MPCPGRNVLDRAADFGARQVVIGIDAQARTVRSTAICRASPPSFAASVTAVGRPALRPLETQPGQHAVTCPRQVLRPQSDLRQFNGLRLQQPAGLSNGGNGNRAPRRRCGVGRKPIAACWRKDAASCPRYRCHPRSATTPERSRQARVLTRFPHDPRYVTCQRPQDNARSWLQKRRPTPFPRHRHRPRQYSKTRILSLIGALAPDWPCDDVP